MLTALLEHLAAVLPYKTLYGIGGPYLSRFSLINLGDRFARLRLHYFHRSDEDQETHGHPWKWVVSLVLTGGYRDIRQEGRKYKRSVLTPGSINFIKQMTFHRVELLDPRRGAWTLFLSGPVVDTWFFKTPDGREVHWKEFIRSKGLEP